jgi:hypothetical protein
MEEGGSGSFVQILPNLFGGSSSLVISSIILTSPPGRFLPELPGKLGLTVLNSSISRKFEVIGMSDSV